MAGLIEELMDTVRKQTEIYEELLEIAAKKKVSIIENNLEALSGFMGRENTLLGKCTKLDKKREEDFKDIAFVLNKNPEQLTMTSLLALIEGQPEEEELRQIRDNAKEVLDKLKRINDLNKELIETSLEHIDFQMNVIRGALSGQPSYYDTAGNEINSSGQMLFDTKQ